MQKPKRAASPFASPGVPGLKTGVLRSILISGSDSSNGKSRWEPWGKIEGKNARACNGCGECEPRCPLCIPIIKQLREVDEALSVN